MAIELRPAVALEQPFQQTRDQSVPPLKVVVVDDDANTCAFMKSVFIAEGHECQAFTRPEDAERHLATSSADVVILDVYLGAANGIDLLQKLRVLHPNLYPVIMTAHVSVETAARSLQ